MPFGHRYSFFCLSNVKSLRENVPSSRLAFSHNGMCGVMSFRDESSAFAGYAEVMPNNCVFLVDTYDTLRGVDRAIADGASAPSSSSFSSDAAPAPTPAGPEGSLASDEALQALRQKLTGGN